MEWTPGGISNDVEDHRDDGVGGGFGGFGGFGFGHLGIGGILFVGLLSLIFGRNFFTLLGGGEETGTRVVHNAPDRQRDAAEQTEAEFVSFVLDDVQKNWDAILPQAENRPYRHAKLVLFRNAYPSGCGLAKDAIGPFYCPEDEKVYLDLSFFDELKNRFGAPGEFAQAYVVAHEIGHHVQKILGIEPKVRTLQERNPGAQNALSVRLELQADCFAGIWANSTQQRRITNASDVKSALNAAAAVGDDRLQKMATGRVSPESFTHGSSAQRDEWFERGLQTGRLSSCNTFSRSQ
ncbi:MAG: neutral zinc metallopeptidase [Bryobacteraceae bacterium]